MGFRLGGLRVVLDFTFFAMLGVFFSLEGRGEETGHILAALLIHELGHLAAASAVRMPMERMTFSCFGIELVRKSGVPAAWWEEALVYLAGPAVNLLCAAGFLCCGQRFLRAGAVQLVLGVFQLLPVGALDGGCLAETVLEHFLGPKRAELWSTALSAAVLIPLFAAGWLLLKGEGRNFTLLVCCGFLMLSIWKK